MTLKKTKQPVQPLPGGESLDEIARRYFSQKEREDMDAEDFGDPEKRAFPVKTQQDLENAARLIGHADHPNAVKERLKAIAKRKGLTLPKAWQDEEDAKESSERAAIPDDPLDDVLNNPDDEDANEDEHAIMEALEGIDGEDEDDEECDDEEMRSQDAGTITRADLPSDVLYYAPITRINKKKREIIGVATVEAKDAYRTVIGYEASKDAFARWRGNIREMHDPKKAVGRALEVKPDDTHKRIIVRAMISKGAEDTWQKVLDKTLTGFSIGGKNGVWTKRIIDGEELPYLERYDAAELSLVDNPACPGCNIEIVRADGLASAILAKDEEMTQKTPVKTPEATAESVERAGARLSQETREAMHMARDHAHQAHMQTAQTCGCDECQDHMNALLEIGKHDDNDGDVDANWLAPATMNSMRRLVGDIVREVVAETLRVQLAPTLQRVNALLFNEDERDDEHPEIARRVDDLSSDIAAIKDLVEKIADQPVSGGPVLHGGPGVAQEKRLATHGADRAVDDAEILRRALEYGFTPPATQEAQVLAASKLIRR